MYHFPNKHTQPEEHTRHILFMRYPFRNENELKFYDSYVEKRESHKSWAYVTLLEDGLGRLATNEETKMDPFGQ